MNTFPNSECYLISWNHGTYGGILTTLVSSLVLDDEYLKNVKVAPSPNGNSHYGFPLAEQTWSPMSKMNIREKIQHTNRSGRRQWEEIDKSEDDGNRAYNDILSKERRELKIQNLDLCDCQWEMAKPKDDVIVMYDHIPVKSYDMLSTIYPNFKQITISYCESDLQQIGLNLFRKLIVDNWIHNLAEQRNYLIMRGDILIEHPTETWLNNYDDARDLVSNSEDFKKFIKLRWPKQPDSCWFDVGTSKYLGPNMFSKSFLDKKAGKHKDQIYYIQFNDVINNPEKVLDQLSSITNRPIKDITRAMYDAWLSKQKLIEDLRDT